MPVPASSARIGFGPSITMLAPSAMPSSARSNPATPTHSLSTVVDPARPITRW